MIMDKLEELSRNFEASVPAVLYADAKIPDGCIRLFCIIQQLHRQDTKFCTASNATLSVYTGSSERTVGRYLKILREAGFLTVRIEVSGEGEERKLHRYLHASNEKITTCRDIVRNF